MDKESIGERLYKLQRLLKQEELESLCRKNILPHLTTHSHF